MFEELLAQIGFYLDKHKFPYMIVGGQAVLLYGEPRLTRDIDVTLGVNTDCLSELLSVLNQLNLKPIPNDVESFVKKTMVLPAADENTGIRVDFIFSFTPYEKEAIKRARQVTILGQAVSFASPEDLIIHKIFAGRPRDIEDAKTVLVKNPGLDIEYIQSWLREFDASSEKKTYIKIWKSILKEIK